MSIDEIANVEKYGSAPYLVFGDHASNAIPRQFNCLGVSPDVLQTHIAWDIGTADVTEALARGLGGVVLTCGFSRLLIDPNRAVERPDIIPSVSDQIPIPGNQMLLDADRVDRIENFFNPYHQRLDEEIEAQMEAHPAPFLVSIHSFTPRLMGGVDERPWQMGLLWREDEASARAFMEFMRRETTFQIGDNQPYDAREFNYSIDRHVGPRKLRHLTIEIRQDIVSNRKDAEEIASLLVRGVKEIANI